MADDMLNSFENMRLKAEEEEIITISDEGRKEEIESCAQSLIGKFLTCKSFNKPAAHNTLRKAWGIEDGVQIVEVGSNLFQFKFKTDFDLERVLKEGQWTFDNQVLLLRKWEAGMTAKNVKFESISIWVQMWGSPFDMVCPQVAAEVGRRIGVVEEVERRRKHDIQNFFMRVKVAIPITKPLRRGGFLSGSDGKKIWVSFKYERLSMHSHYCGVLGHDLKHCATYFALTKNGGQVECEYGEWLKASGGRSRSPTRRGMGMTRPPTAAHEEEESHREAVGSVLTARCTRSETLTVHEGREDGKSEILGTVSDGNRKS